MLTLSRFGLSRTLPVRVAEGFTAQPRHPEINKYAQEKKSWRKPRSKWWVIAKLRFVYEASNLAGCFLKVSVKYVTVCHDERCRVHPCSPACYCLPLILICSLTFAAIICHVTDVQRETNVWMLRTVLLYYIIVNPNRQTKEKAQPSL